MVQQNTKSLCENEIGKLVRDRRKTLGMSQTTLAETLGLETEAMIVKIEKGTKELPAKHILKICKVLGIRRSTLISLRVKAYRQELLKEVQQCG